MSRVRLSVRVIPRAPRDRIGGERAGRLLIRVAAAPEDGAANRAVRALLAERLGIPGADVLIERGATARDKIVSLPGGTAAAVAALMK